MCALVLECDVFGLVEPSDIVVLDEDVAGFAGDGGGFSEFNGGFVVLVYGGRQWLGMPEVCGKLAVENYVFSSFCECFIFGFARVE